MAGLINKMIDEAKSISNLGMISPDSLLRKQIETAITPKVKLSKKQKPKIIIVEENKKTRKAKPKSPIIEKPKSPIIEKPKSPIIEKEKPKKKTKKNKKELIVNITVSPEEHKLEGISNIK